MNAKEIIEHLQKFPPEKVVYIQIDGNPLVAKLHFVDGVGHVAQNPTLITKSA